MQQICTSRLITEGTKFSFSCSPEKGSDALSDCSLRATVSFCCVKVVRCERSSQILLDSATTEETVKADICMQEGGGGGKERSVGGKK